MASLKFIWVIATSPEECDMCQISKVVTKVSPAVACKLCLLKSFPQGKSYATSPCAFGTLLKGAVHGTRAQRGISFEHNRGN